jgi:ElaB/YqjD/DUF883 family membrane-anchored ribosome-binding protein
MNDDALQAVRLELDTLAERLSDAAYESLRAQVRHGVKPAKDDPDLVREKLLSRARHAVERASGLVSQAENIVDSEP